MAVKKRGRTSGKENKEGNIIQEAVRAGVDRILEAHPQLRGAEESIYEQIDRKKLEKGVSRLVEYVKEQGDKLNDEERAQFIYKNLSDYVASGRVFNKEGERDILRESLEERTRNKGAERSDEEAVYLNNVGDAFRKIYHLMKAGDYGQRMPEFEQSVKIINDLGFLDSALDVLNSRGLIEKGEYADVKRRARKRIEEETETFGRTYQKYLAPRKVAAGIIGFLGVLLVLFFGTRGITGAAIGVGGSRVMGGIAGVFLIMVSLVFFIFGKNGKRKNR